MTPPKITRPAVPEVQHTFPAWYFNKNTKKRAFFIDRQSGVEVSERPRVVNPMDVTTSQNWERLPSGSKIEFTQP